jgi:ABC-2 type transport system ATP-binding protein
MIEVQGLTKSYGAVEAVKDVSFSVGQDQVLGFLGPNGAGKTTIMKILTGYHFPSSGSVLVDGVSVQEDPVEVKKRIGYLPETVPVYGDLTVDEYLSFVAEARLIPKEARRGAIGAALRACGLEQVRSKRIETLSKGYKQRVGLAQAIAHDPAILILDEPTTGLDPNQIIEVRSLIKELGKRKTVILSTHILQEVEAVCSRVLILNEGRIAAQGTPEEIAATMKGGDTWELALKVPGLRGLPGFAGGSGSSGMGGADITITEGLEGIFAGLELETRGAVGRVLGDDLLALSFFVKAGLAGEDGGKSGPGERIFDWAVSRGFKILEMNRKKLSIEDIFVRLTNEEGAKL